MVFEAILKKVKLSVKAIFFAIILILSQFDSVALANDEVKKNDQTKNSDAALAEKLKAELDFNMQRRKGFRKQNDELKFYNREREKGLALFLEEQEKFEIEREKGLAEHKKTKTKSLDESSPEYFADLKDKKNRENWQEDSRLNHVKTRDQIISQYRDQENHSELEELDLYNNRPRFDLRKRYNNKWVKNSGKSNSSGSSFGGGAPVPDYVPDFPAPLDYAPQPVDNFEEIPPPPPAIPYDQGFGGNSGGYDSGFGDAPMPPAPPPPPEGGWDF